ncbi:sugar ABC transporter substrate-binding protein [Brucella gallinifaecis]|uniref:Sugar ABC transporter substrate-binding protein n=1 Tax=Brucella gallinifaecis TaxID=215590 RepID=A0A502BID6_9HYPH|nr:sugar ABC transporter substrate-binding protein [Brucella gallinifaecis]TPF74030.1 sugar ABC transporter substrate-binding protein [Brucella gallinifaecis]
MSNLRNLIKLTTILGACFTLSNTAALAEDIGFVLAGPDIFYATEAETFTNLAKKAGHNVTVANSEYSPSKELANVEDFIARKVDAIVLLTANAEAGTQAAERAKEAGIPIFFVSALPSPAGYNIPTGIVSGDWIGMGKTIGAHIGTAHPGKGVILLEGVYGQGTTELIHEGFLQGVDSVKGNNTIVANASGGWNRQEGLKVMQDFLGSKKEFSVVYAMNEEMMAGAIQALEEAGRLGDYTLYSSNGKEIAWDWMKAGTLAGTVANTPTVEADLIFQMVQAHFDGKEYPRHVYNIQPMLTADTLGNAIPWNIENYLKKKEDGSLDIDLYKQPLVEGMVDWTPIKDK